MGRCGPGGGYDEAEAVSSEWAVIGLTALLLALMVGWRLGADSVRQLTAQAARPAARRVGGAFPFRSGGRESFSGPLRRAGRHQHRRAGGAYAAAGIGEKRAQAILDWREEHGPFSYVEDLIQVPGIGEGILEGLMDQAIAGGETNAEDTGSG